MPHSPQLPTPAHPGPNASWDFVGLYRRCLGCGTYYDEDVDPGPTCRTTLPWPVDEAPLTEDPVEGLPEGRFARTDPDDLPRIWWREHDLVRIATERTTQTPSPTPTHPPRPASHTQRRRPR